MKLFDPITPLDKLHKLEAELDVVYSFSTDEHTKDILNTPAKTSKDTDLIYRRLYDGCIAVSYSAGVDYFIPAPIASRSPDELFDFLGVGK